MSREKTEQMDSVETRKFERVKLYVLLTSGPARQPLEDVACAVLEAGAQAVQLREKRKSDSELLLLARKIREHAAHFNAVMIINDRPDIAVLCDADGVHLGQDDLPVSEVRRILGSERLIGISTHNLVQVRAAERDSVDYIGVGPVFATATKGYPTGLGCERVRKLIRNTQLPTVAIGGIKLENVGDVIRSGVQAVAVCSAIVGSSDPFRATKLFLSAIEDVS